ncbi:MAG: RNA polymerase sigma factor [Acidimicrobiales bacterium]
MGLTNKARSGPEIELIETRDLDRSDYDEIYTRCFRRIYALAYALTGSAATAEDIAQESLLAAFRQWPKVAGYENPDAWIRRVAINRCISLHRRSTSEADAVARLAARPQPELRLPDHEETLWAAVRALPTRQAQAIALHYVEDLPVAAIAETLGCSASSVKAHLRRGRAALAATVDREEAL